MEAAFGGFVQGLGGDGSAADVPGLSSAGSTQKAVFIHRDGPRFRTGQGSLGVTKQGEADLLIWEAPNGQRMLTFVVVPCPRCGYQQPVHATQMNAQNVPVSIATADERGLTLHMHLQCPAHWEEMTPQGHTTGRRQKCGFSGVIREGVVHSTRCPLADFRQPHSAHNCRCGGLLTDQQIEIREAELAEQRRAL